MPDASSRSEASIEDIAKWQSGTHYAAAGETLNDLQLSFTAGELSSYVAYRTAGLADASRDWVVRASTVFWHTTQGIVSRRTMERLREETLTRYQSTWSHGKAFAFAKAFLVYLTKTRFDTRYHAFDVFLERPKTVKVRKAATSRIVTHADIENVLAYIKNAGQTGTISTQRALEYAAFVIFGAYPGQRSMSTISRLTVGQFREAIFNDKPVLHVTAEQDKIRMEHHVPLHAEVVRAVRPLLDGRADADLMFSYTSFLMWVKRQKIPMFRFRGHFVLGDLRKFAEQYGDIIGWEQSNRAYILTHGVSGVDWTHYKCPLPEHTYDVYMKYWGDVRLRLP
ncbi:MAG: hypothetical protein ACXV49_09015 [Halobacteriota archaeon]